MFAFVGAPGPVESLMLVFWVALIIWPFWRIFTKAGFNGALSLLMLVPLVNLVMIFFLAFAEWPALKETGQDA